MIDTDTESQVNRLRARSAQLHAEAHRAYAMAERLEGREEGAVFYTGLAQSEERRELVYLALSEGDTERAMELCGAPGGNCKACGAGPLPYGYTHCGLCDAEER